MMKVFASDPLHILPVDVFRALEGKSYRLFLDSADQAHPDSRYSYVMASPLEVITFKDGFDNPFELVADKLKSYEAIEAQLDPDIPPFRGGAAGFFGYDLGRAIEKLPSIALSNDNWPDMVVGIYDTLYAYDHHLERGYIITRANGKALADEKMGEFQAHVEKKWPAIAQNFPDIKWDENFTRQSYQAIIERTIDYIRSGDIFQANITRRFDAALPSEYSPAIHYEVLRKVNPAPFAGYFEAGAFTLASASPERFLTCDAKGNVQTKPIKGTRPHYPADPLKDRAEIDDLMGSDKDRAENIMIVDLLRNDLSKSCIPESIAVPELCALETFASVHHLVSTVTGKLRSDKSSLDLLKGCFPGGSITGAPKIRAMEIIEELEPTRRGPYCGALGYIGFDGAMDMNILIRTLIFERGKVSFQVGGGIVADSDPEAEYIETLTKAHGLLKSFKIAQ